MPGPKYDHRLRDLAFEHDGILTVVEMKKAGIDPQRARQFAHRGRLERVLRGIYRLPEYPADPRRQEYWTALLWPAPQETARALSHATALSLHGLSDLVAEHIDVTLAERTRIRRSDAPHKVEYHFANLPARDIEWLDGLPITSLKRTLLDCAGSGVSARFVREALIEAQQFGKISAGTADRVEETLNERI